MRESQFYSSFSLTFLCVLEVKILTSYHIDLSLCESARRTVSPLIFYVVIIIKVYLDIINIMHVCTYAHIKCIKKANEVFYI